MRKRDENMQINPVKNTTILPLTIDEVFKMYFKNPDNLPELRSFLMAHIEIDADDLEEIQIIEPELPKPSVDDKGFIVDLLLKTKSGNDIHVEMQTGKETHFKERTQLYNARKTGEQLKKGQGYQNAKRTISIIIIDFDMFVEYNRYHERLFMKRDNGEIFTKIQEINIINLTRIEEINSYNREQAFWGKLFKVSTKYNM